MYKYLIILFVSMASQALAQLQSPEAFFGHPYGEQFTQHHQLVDYVKHVAANSDRVSIEQYGVTNQHRPLVLLYISTPENLKNIEVIRVNNLRRAGMATDAINKDFDRAIVWFSYGVHGNEAGASESSMDVLYALASGNTDGIDIDLSRTVVIMDPCVNPDGYNRYVQWYINQSGVEANPASFTAEHDEPWPGGRVNHYLFDLNRDWAWASQVETQQRLVKYQSWLPHIHGDYHEQYPDDPYYFAPAAQPYHEYISDWQRKFQFDIGMNNAKYFDSNQWLYFTREVFDLFYPSYGDTYPMFNGALGMTYEQAGHSISGRAILMENHDTLKLQDRIDHHRTASLATIQEASNNVDQIVSEFQNYFEKSKLDPIGRYKTYIVRNDDKSNQAIKALKHLLDQHNIQYAHAGFQKRVYGYLYEEMKDGAFDVESQDLVISAYQAKSVLVQTLFEPTSKLTDSLTYDITAWAIPYAYGLTAVATELKLDGEQGKSRPNAPERETNGNSVVAYYLPWSGMQSARCLSDLHKAGLGIRYNKDKIQHKHGIVERGSIIITLSDNKRVDNPGEKVIAIAGKHGIPVNAMYSGFAISGPDLGSGSVEFMQAPKIMVLRGELTSSYTFGHIWHYLDKQLQYPFAATDVRELDGSILKDYNVLIMPDGRYGFGDTQMEILSEFMSDGGKVIAIGSAIRVFQDKDGFSVKAFADDGKQSEQQQMRKQYRLDHRLDNASERLRSGISDWTPGAIVKLNLDKTHPLSYGLGNSYFTLKTSSSAYEHMTGIQNVGYIENEVHYQGFIGSRMEKNIQNTSSIFVEQHGRGSLICLVDNPVYRGFWYSGMILFANAIFF